MAEISGVCEEPFAGVRDALAANLDSGLDVGASVAVFVDGVAVVDIWGGSLDEAGSVPWRTRHHHQRVVDHQDDDRPVRTHPG